MEDIERIIDGYTKIEVPHYKIIENLILTFNSNIVFEIMTCIINGYEEDIVYWKNLSFIEYALTD